MVASYTIAAAAVTAMSLSGCGSGGQSNDVYCKGTPIEIGDCPSSLSSSSADCSEVCVLDVLTMTPDDLASVDSLHLLSSVQGTIHNTTNGDEMFRITIHPAALPAVVATLDEGKVCIGFNSDTVSRLPSDKQKCVDSTGMKVDVWKEDGSLSSLELSSSATVVADELTASSGGSYHLDIDLSSSASATVGRVHGTSLNIEQSSSSKLSVQQLDFARAYANVASSGSMQIANLELSTLDVSLSSSAHMEAQTGSVQSVTAKLSSSAHVNMGKVQADSAELTLASSATFEGMDLSKSLEVDLSSSASVSTEASEACAVTGTCSSGSKLTVTGADVSAVKGDCTSSFAAVEMV